MKLSKQTLEFLANLNNINKSIHIKAAETTENFTKIRTKSTDGNLYGEVDIPEIFTKDACFFELNKFIQCVKSMGGEEAEIEFKDNFANVKNGKNSVKLVYTDPSYIITPDFTRKRSTHPAVLEFSLTQDDMKKLLDNAKILQLPHIQVLSNNGKIIIRAIDERLPSSNTYEIELKDGDLDEKYVIKTELLTILQGNYTFKITENYVDLMNTSFADANLMYRMLLEETNV